MNIVMVNASNYGCTGNIMAQTAEIAQKRGHRVYCYAPYSRSSAKHKENPGVELFGNILSNAIHCYLAKLTGFEGFFSIIPTLHFVEKMKRIKPDLICLHNIHGSKFNIPILFNYISKNNIKVVFTLHDCWSFTGKCPHFTIEKCDKWKTLCFDCPIKDWRCHLGSVIDNSKTVYKLKKKYFCSIRNMKIVTPSRWLADLVKQSFLNKYQVNVINNGIDLTIFKPSESDFREKHNLKNKYIVLGVAGNWGARKGVDVFNKMAKVLNRNHTIVLVGECKEKLSTRIIHIPMTWNRKELAEIYTAADVFVNPTREDNFPTVNLEALACGTPIIAFQTGGACEAFDETCGMSVPVNDFDSLIGAIRQVKDNPFSSEDCLRRAKNFDKDKKLDEYVDLYEGMCDK